MFRQVQIIAALAVTALLMSISTAEPYHQPQPGTDEPKLQIISVTLERVEANFFSPMAGIHIHSQVHSDGELVQVSITTMDGETLFAVDRPVDSSQSLLTMDGNEFLMINETLDEGETKLSEYAIPEAYSLQVRNAMKRHMLPKSLLRHLDRENVNTSGRNAIDNMLMRPEVQLIATAAFALGDTGLYGYENPAVMAFYATALRFSTVLAERDHDMSKAVERNKRGWFDWLFGSQPQEYCSNSDSNCDSGYCPIGQGCLGLCGPGCTCWWIVCGDCCYNQGCYDHDVDDCSGGTSTLQCWLTAPLAILNCS